MIKEQDILDAIAECQGERNPNANTCRNLASFYTILDHIRGDDTSSIDNNNTGYSYMAMPDVTYQSDSEFYSLIKDMDINKILELFDEVMDTLQVINPKLYASIIRRVE